MEADEGLTDEDHANFELLDEYEIAEGTRRTYEYQWRRWQEWAASRKVESLPADPIHVKAYLAERALKLGHAPATVRGAAAAISYMHRDKGEPDPCIDREVKKTLSGIARKKRRPQKQARPLTAGAFRKIIKVAFMPRRGKGGGLESPEAALLRGQVDVAMIGLMRDALLRVSEAANAVWGDLERYRDGSGLILIRQSKTDQEGEGMVRFVSSFTMAYLDAIREGAPDDASIFGLKANQITIRIKRAALESGCGKGFSGHSPRVGMATDLARAGTSLTRLMNAGGWTSTTMPAHYTRNEAARKGAVAEYHNRQSA